MKPVRWSKVSEMVLRVRLARWRRSSSLQLRSDACRRVWRFSSPDPTHKQRFLSNEEWPLSLSSSSSLSTVSVISLRSRPILSVARRGPVQSFRNQPISPSMPVVSRVEIDTWSAAVARISWNHHLFSRRSDLLGGISPLPSGSERAVWCRRLEAEEETEFGHRDSSNSESAHLAFLEHFSDRSFVFHGKQNDIFVGEFLNSLWSAERKISLEVLLEGDGSLLRCVWFSARNVHRRDSCAEANERRREWFSSRGNWFTFSVRFRSDALICESNEPYFVSPLFRVRWPSRWKVTFCLWLVEHSSLIPCCWTKLNSSENENKFNVCFFSPSLFLSFQWTRKNNDGNSEVLFFSRDHSGLFLLGFLLGFVIGPQFLIGILDILEREEKSTFESVGDWPLVTFNNSLSSMADSTCCNFFSRTMRCCSSAYFFFLIFCNF